MIRALFISQSVPLCASIYNVCLLCFDVQHPCVKPDSVKLVYGIFWKSYFLFQKFHVIPFNLPLHSLLWSDFFFLNMQKGAGRQLDL